MASSTLPASGAHPWRRHALKRLEDLRDAVLGAGLEPTQMSRGVLTGSLAFVEHDGITCSSGYISGRVGLAGSLSRDNVTIGVGLQLGPGSRHWLKEVSTGDVGVFLPGDDHDALYTPGALYMTVTLDAERLEAAAARLGLVLDARTLGGTGIHHRKLAPEPLARLRSELESVHADDAAAGQRGSAHTRHLLDLLIAHCAREPRAGLGPADFSGPARIVKRARTFIEENLQAPISVDTMAAASYTSRRTLFRAFITVLGEPPASYVRRRRLHRIRHGLACDVERTCTVALVANRWGIAELGRMAGWYRDLFGESPSDTLARALNDPTRPRDEASPPWSPSMRLPPRSRL